MTRVEQKKKIYVSEMALKVTAARASERAMCCPPFRRLTSRLCTSKYFVNGFFEKDMARRKSKKKKAKKKDRSKSTCDDAVK